MKNSKRRRMTSLDIQMVVEEINAWANGERSRRLTWSILEKVFPFTRQTMFSKADIKTAYERAQIALKNGRKVKTAIYSGQVDDIQIQALKKRIAELEAQIEEWQRMWVSTN